MSDREDKLPPGLYLVATPIGNLGDITSRGVEILSQADEIWAEDTRNTRKLLNLLDIRRAPSSLRPNHDHNEGDNLIRLVETITSGRSIALVSDAGTPLVSDPGYRLVDAALEAGLYVTAVPGPSAVIAALTLSGAPSDRFGFYGFVPNKATKRAQFLTEIKKHQMTAILFESAKRLNDTIAAIAEAMGDQTRVTILRELTKKFEERISGTAGALCAQSAEYNWRGEIVIVIAPSKKAEIDEAVIIAQLTDALATMKMNQAVKFVANATNWPRNEVYRLALQIKDSIL